ncbi:MAG TPA: hypothetical protein VL921_21850 [Candidatus Udaeobacter sp.]|jgi:hypothetical protein|nr:hypothetical protein [Candidatus Udaeobacter sp.]
MTFTVSDWILYTMWAVLGLLIIDFLISFVKAFWAGSFDPYFALGYLKDVLYYVLPLNVILTLRSIDPTSWILVSLYFILALAVILHYLWDIKRKFK